MAKTAGFIVQRAVELAQLDSSFLTLARQYYNLVIEDSVSDFDFPYLRAVSADTPFVSGQVAYALPTDYSRSDTCYLKDGNGNRRAIIIMSKYRFDRMQVASYSGDPTKAYIDQLNQKIVFDAAPSGTTRYYSLTYFQKQPDIDDQGGDDTVDCPIQSPQFVVYEIASMLLDYNDDERAQSFEQKAAKMLHDHKLNCFDEDNTPQIEFGPAYKPGSRPTRGGGSGWWGT